MTNINHTRIIISTLIVSFFFLLGINSIDTVNSKSNRDKIISNIDQELTSTIENRIDSQLHDQQNKWGYSMVEYNPNSGIVKNSSIKNGEFVESLHIVKR